MVITCYEFTVWLQRDVEMVIIFARGHTLNILFLEVNVMNLNYQCVTKVTNDNSNNSKGIYTPKNTADCCKSFIEVSLRFE